MPDRRHFIATLRLLSSLTLLAFVLVASIRLSGAVVASSHPDCLHGISIQAPGQPTTCLDAEMASNAVRRLKALSSENEEDEEEERADALVEPRISFRRLCSLREFSERQLIVPRSALSRYPLRC